MEKILVIDDEKPTLAMFRLTLEAYGYHVLTAENGREGLEIFERERPPVVLTDIKMPGMDGIAVLRAVKERAPQTEVIVITGHGDMDLAIKALDLDASDFINKPIQRQVLEQALTYALGRWRLAAGQVQELTLEWRGEAAVIAVQGSLTARSEARLMALFKESQSRGAGRLVLHFSPSAAVNGAGIALLTQLLLESGRQGRAAFIAGLSGNLHKVFEMVGVAKLATLVPRLEDALA
jgi:YesN/AraC family two-component response regulator